MCLQVNLPKYRGNVPELKPVLLIKERRGKNPNLNLQFLYDSPLQLKASQVCQQVAHIYKLSNKSSYMQVQGRHFTFQFTIQPYLYTPLSTCYCDSRYEVGTEFSCESKLEITSTLRLQARCQWSVDNHTNIL